MAKKKHKAKTVPVHVRSLWTCIATGHQIILTSVRSDWVDYLSTGTMGYGGMRRDLLRECYVLAGRDCHITARAIHDAS